jgi:hypothetical protein
MSIKFEGKPPFYLGIVEVASAHALDGSVILPATISVPVLPIIRELQATGHTSLNAIAGQLRLPVLRLCER